VDCSFNNTKNTKPENVQINKVASCKNLKDVKHLKLDIKNEITEKYKNLYKSKIAVDCSFNNTMVKVVQNFSSFFGSI
jgi:hypothetical protein